MSDPLAGTSTRNILQHILSPKLVGPTGGTYSVKTDLINIHTLTAINIMTPVVVAPNASTGYAGITNSSDAINCPITMISPTQVAQNTGATGATPPKYPCSYTFYASSANGGGLAQDCFDIFAYVGNGDYTKVGTNDIRVQDANNKWYTNPIQQGLRIVPSSSDNATGTTTVGKGFGYAVCLTNPGFIDSMRVGVFTLPANTTTYTTPTITSITRGSKMVVYLVSGVLTNTVPATYTSTVTESTTNTGGTITVTFSVAPSTNPVQYGYTIYG